MRKVCQFLLIFAVIFYLLSIIFLLLKIPSIWSDEAIYADIAHNLISQNRLGYDLLGLTRIGLDQQTYWYPPIFLSTIALWFKLFGESIFIQRLLSVFISLCFLVMYYLLIKNYIFTAALGIDKTVRGIGINISLAILLVDFNFLNAAKISRPEILVLLFGTISLYFLLKYQNNGQNHPIFYPLISGLFSSFALLSHYQGLLFFCSILIYFLINFKKKLFKEKSFLIFIVGFIIPVLFWLLTIYPNYQLFIEQVKTFSETRNNVVPWFVVLFMSSNWLEQTIFMGYLIISIPIYLSLKLFKDRKQTILIFVFIFAWIFSSIGKLGWYLVYVIPFTNVLSVFIFFKFHTQNKSSFTKLDCISKYIITVGLAAIFISNIFLQFSNLQSFSGQNYSYELFSQKLLNLIPPNKNVFESSLPDAYYALKGVRPKTKLYQFPSIYITRDEYINILNDSDYVIYTKNYSPFNICDLLTKYLKMNQLHIIYFEQPGQYSAQVIELVPRNKRIIPTCTPD